MNDNNRRFFIAIICAIILVGGSYLLYLFNQANPIVINTTDNIASSIW